MIDPIVRIDKVFHCRGAGAIIASDKRTSQSKQCIIRYLFKNKINITCNRTKHVAKILLSYCYEYNKLLDTY